MLSCAAKVEHRVDRRVGLVAIDNVYTYVYTWNIPNKSTMKTKLVRWGNSHAVRIPRAILKKAAIREGQNVEIKAGKSGRITIQAAQARLTLASLVAGITPENRQRETEWGQPVGNEIR
jgi:antitoxin MazE